MSELTISLLNKDKWNYRAYAVVSQHSCKKLLTFKIKYSLMQKWIMLRSFLSIKSHEDS